MFGSVTNINNWRKFLMQYIRVECVDFCHFDVIELAHGLLDQRFGGIIVHNEH